MVFDLTFFIFINTIIMNIVFGVIIDTFQEMRDEAVKRDDIIKNTCLICLKNRQEIQESETSFDYHVNVYHKIWTYVEFVIYIIEQKLEDLTSIEEHVYNQYIAQKNNWLPFSDNDAEVSKQEGGDDDEEEDEISEEEGQGKDKFDAEFDKKIEGEINYIKVQIDDMKNSIKKQNDQMAKIINLLETK